MKFLDRRSVMVGSSALLVATKGGAVTSGDCSGERIEVYQDGNGKWRWRLYASNGEQIAEHLEQYNSKKGCLAGIEAVRSAINNAEIVEGCDS